MVFFTKLYVDTVYWRKLMNVFDLNQRETCLQLQMHVLVCRMYDIQ